MNNIYRNFSYRQLALNAKLAVIAIADRESNRERHILKNNKYQYIIKQKIFTSYIKNTNLYMKNY